jgi:hypothetical protein
MAGRPQSAPGAAPETTVYVELVDRLVDPVVADTRVRALWIEGESPRALRRPFGRVAIHLVADEPDFPALTGALEGLLARAGVELANPRWSDTRRHARQLDARAALDAGGVRLAGDVTIIVECSAFLAKRPRRADFPIVDKTGHLTHVMDFPVRS